jgi:hypothetical protein
MHLLFLDISLINGPATIKQGGDAYSGKHINQWILGLFTAQKKGSLPALGLRWWLWIRM